MGSSAAANHEMSSSKNALTDIQDSLTSLLHQQGDSTSHLSLRGMCRLCLITFTGLALTDVIQLQK